MKISEACESPTQPRCNSDERNHPQYGAYLTYRSQCAAQLVEACPFHSWVRSKEFIDDHIEFVMISD